MSEAKRSAPPKVGGADATLRERNKCDKSNANCHARLSEAGLVGLLSRGWALARPVAPTPLASELGPGSAAELRSAFLSWGFARSEGGEALPHTPQEGSAPS